MGLLAEGDRHRREADPAMRLYVMDSVPPRDWYLERPGRWIAEQAWPSPEIAMRSASPLGDGGALSERRADDHPHRSRSPQDCGMAGGEYCAIWLGPELPGDQRDDDLKSACFDGAPLDAPLDIVGGPVVRLSVRADRPKGMLAVRLCDVQPDGASTRITYGVLNLCHRGGHEFPESLRRGDDGDRARLDDIAYAYRRRATGCGSPCPRPTGRWSGHRPSR